MKYKVGDTICYKKKGEYVLDKIVKIKEDRYIKTNGKSIKENMILFSVKEAMGKVKIDCDRCLPEQCENCFNWYTSCEVKYCDDCGLRICSDCDKGKDIIKDYDDGWFCDECRAEMSSV